MTNRETPINEGSLNNNKAVLDNNQLTLCIISNAQYLSCGTACLTIITFKV